MRRRSSDEIVTTVVCGTGDEVTRKQCCKGNAEQRWRQVRTVAVESNDAQAARGEVREYRSESRAQPVTGLRNHANARAGDARQFFGVSGWAHHGGFHTVERLGQGKGVLEKTAVQSGNGSRR